MRAAALPEQHRPVLVRARAIYMGDSEEGWGDLGQQVRAYSDYVVAEIEKLPGLRPGS